VDNAPSFSNTDTCVHPGHGGRTTYAGAGAGRWSRPFLRREDNPRREFEDFRTLRPLAPDEVAQSWWWSSTAATTSQDKVVCPGDCARPPSSRSSC